MTSNPSGTIAITGATGLLGSHLCRRFADAGWNVRALVRDSARARFDYPGIRYFRCDLPDIINPEAMRDVDVLIHAAYATRSNNREQDRRVNEEGSMRLMEAARRAAVRKFVFVSSTAAHPVAPAYYGQSKLAIERALDPARDLAIRPGLILAAEGGLFQRLVNSIRKMGIVPLFGGGRQHIQTVHIDDLCLAFQRAVELDLAGAITVAESEGLRFRELFRLTAAALGRRCIFLPIPFAPALAALKAVEAVGLRLPISSQNLLGIQGLRHVPCADDLTRLGITARPAYQSLNQLLNAN